MKSQIMVDSIELFVVTVDMEGEGDILIGKQFSQFLGVVNPKEKICQSISDDDDDDDKRGFWSYQKSQTWTKI